MSVQLVRCNTPPLASGRETRLQRGLSTEANRTWNDKTERAETVSVTHHSNMPVTSNTKYGNLRACVCGRDRQGKFIWVQCDGVCKPELYPQINNSLYRTKCYFKTHSLYRNLFSLVIFVKKYQNLHVFKYIYTYTGGSFKITFYSTKCLQIQRVSADSRLCTWCTA